MNWVLPDHVSDLLPQEASRVELLRRSLLELFRLRGFELVSPPLIEHLESLFNGSGKDLELKTFSLVDQLSGRTLGVRPDMTPQVARIDAHLLNRSGVTRLCYCGSVLHALPVSQTVSREQIQLGAEIYGHAGIEADQATIRLMADALETASVGPEKIDLGHVGIFRALVEAAGLNEDLEQEILQQLQAKDTPSLRECCAAIAEPYRSAFLRLPELYGSAKLLDLATRELPNLPQITSAIDSLKRINSVLNDLPLSFDLGDLRGYRYHNGVVFAAYQEGSSIAIARGGRYDGIGRAFGRDRLATGFSMDLREVTRLAKPSSSSLAIQAPYAALDPKLSQRVRSLREQGEIVVELFSGETRCEGVSCDRQLLERDGEWVVQKMDANSIEK